MKQHTYARQRVINNLVVAPRSFSLGEHGRDFLLARVVSDNFFVTPLLFVAMRRRHSAITDPGCWNRLLREVMPVGEGVHDSFNFQAQTRHLVRVVRRSILGVELMITWTRHKRRALCQLLPEVLTRCILGGGSQLHFWSDVG